MISNLPPRDAPGRGPRLLRAALALLIALALPGVALADNAAEPTDARLHRIEGEVRALQRKVFPDGAGRTFAPQISPDDQVAPTPVPSSNAGAVSDLLARMDAVEAQLRSLTASSEDNQNRLSKLESRIGAVESAQTVAATPAPVTAPVLAPARPPVAVRQVDAAPAPSTPQAAERSAAVAAINRPSTDDKGDDAYTYGYRLWEAKFFPEAESVLLDFETRYPTHKRISYARNLLGRAYLDDTKVRMAAQVFLKNYLSDKAGDRAPDSLLYLAIAETRDKEPARACKALGEFLATYPTEASGRLKGQYDSVTRTVTCR